MHNYEITYITYGGHKLTYVCNARNMQEALAEFRQSDIGTDSVNEVIKCECVFN